ncbi:MAG: hypothetical protein JWQ66_4662 [Mucilaginibacter sp.]|nr:hypothetical protein [Mucilaginibacter sp.]
MTNLPTLEARLRAANPIPDELIPTMPHQAARDFATAIMDTEPTAGVAFARRPPARLRPTKVTVRRALMAAAVIGAVTAGSFALTSGPSVSRAYATWSPTPTPLSAAAAQAAASQCRDLMRLTRDDYVIGSERRGVYYYVALAGPDSRTTCLLKDMQDGRLTSVAGGETTGWPNTPQPTGSHVVVETGGGGNPDGSSYVSAIGRSGPDVKGIDLEMPDGTRVQSTVAGGWWTFWAPGAQMPLRIDVQHADGTATVQAFKFDFTSK